MYNNNTLSPVSTNVKLSGQLNCYQDQNLGLGIYVSPTGSKFKIFSDDYSDSTQKFTGYILGYLGNTMFKNTSNGYFGISYSTTDFGVEFMPNKSILFNFTKIS